MVNVARHQIASVAGKRNHPAVRRDERPVRPTIAALSRHVGAKEARRLFADFARGFSRGINRIEQVRHGRTDAIDAMLRIPDDKRLEEILAKGGAVLAIPHTHASLAMGRGLARRFPILALVRSGGSRKRAEFELNVAQAEAVAAKAAAALEKATAAVTALREEAKKP